jgi:hypothetical protein
MTEPTRFGRHPGAVEPHQKDKQPMHVAQNGRGGQSDLAALRELLLEAIARVKPGIDIAEMPCKDLVQRIDARGEQAAAVLATKLNAELAQARWIGPECAATSSLDAGLFRPAAAGAAE